MLSRLLAQRVQARVISANKTGHTPFTAWRRGLLPISLDLVAFRSTRQSSTTAKRISKRWPFGLLFFCGTSLTAAVYYTSSPPVPLSPHYFVPLTLKAKQSLNSTTSLLTLQVPEAQRPTLEGPIQSLHVMQPEISIQRAYTPLDVQGFKGDLELVVKRYPDGEVSKYLHRLQVGEEVKVRGPIQTWALDPSVDHIVYIAGGTGITPFYQLINYLSTQDTLRPDLTLIYASADPEQVLLRTELDAAAASYKGKTRLHYLVDQPGDGKFDKIGRMQTADLKKWLGEKRGKSLVLVCGPEGMVESVAGPRPRSREMRMRGVQGMLGQLGWKEEEVRRL